LFLVIVFWYTGPEPGVLSNTKKWKATTPRSQYSPFMVQGDVGFFQYKKKNYGQFFCAVNTFTRKVFAIPIRNLKSNTLIDAIDQMLKVKIPLLLLPTL
jgi:hypothetical protein